MIIEKRTSDEGEPFWQAIISIGRNANENDMLWKQANQTDLWFHLRNHPSAHVYLSIQGNPNKRTMSCLLNECANFVRCYSKCAGNAQVNMLERRHVAKGGKPGEVILKKSPSIMWKINSINCPVLVKQARAPYQIWTDDLPDQNRWRIIR